MTLASGKVLSQRLCQALHFNEVDDEVEQALELGVSDLVLGLGTDDMVLALRVGMDHEVEGIRELHKEQHWDAKD